MQNPNAIAAPVNVALLYQTSQFETHLKEALNELGADVVYEAATAGIDRDALENSGARVVIVNLDPEIESHLDEVYDLLDDARYNVVFNDGTVSSALSGWDQARWARHLAAKMLGRPDVDPPRPVNAEAPRSPAQRVAERIPDVELVIPAPYETAAATSPYAGDVEIGVALDALMTRADERPESLRPAQSDPGAVHVPERHVEPAYDVDVYGESHASAPTIPPSATPVPPPPMRASESLDLTSELDALIGAVPSSTLTHDAPEHGDVDLDAELDSLLTELPADATNATVASAMVDFNSVELGEDEAITLVDFDAAPDPAFGAPLPSDADFTGAFDTLPDTLAVKTQTDVPKAGLGAFADWSLEALDEDSETPSSTAAAKPVAPERSDAAAFGVQKMSAESFLSGNWSLETIDESGGEAEASDPATFGVEKIEARKYLAPEGGGADQFAGFDTGFKLDLVPMEEAVSPARSDYVVEHHLGGVVIGTPRGVIQRVIVLGASIGGPEAVREFLAALPPRFPALFLLAQHMSAEFLELMSAQLAKVTPLTVRNPTHGERVGHGEVVVVPTSHRLLVDADGIVQLAQLTETSNYSPSIDLVLRDVADRFGANATAIIFSGMAHDAVEGGKYLAEKGGTIWAQDPDTCVISSMVDGARAAGIVSFLAGPQQLAQRTLDIYGKA